MKICVIGASGKLGKYIVAHALDRGHEVVGVCREKSVRKLDEFKDRITIVQGKTNDRKIIEHAVAGCDGVLTVLVPWGMQHYSSGTAQAVLDFAPSGSRLIFSCGWHISMDGQDAYSRKFLRLVGLFRRLGRFLRLVDIDDQVEACNRIFKSDRKWTVVRGPELEEGESQGLPLWSRHIGDPVLASNLVRRTDFGLCMVDTLTNDNLVHEAPAIVGCKSESAVNYGSQMGEE
jgi:hypothetical protein